jgi:hypothetical protein
MKRRSFIQGTAAALGTWPFVRARAQSGQAPPKANETVIYNRFANELNELRFNPLDPSHTREELYHYDLPFPDPQSPLFETWRKIFSPLPKYETFEFIKFEPAFDYALSIPLSAGRAPIITTRWETSLNWSGAYLEPRNGNMFIEVTANWQIPDLSAAQNPAPSQSSTIWVGLDGQRGYFNSSLPQIGTTQAFDKLGNPDYHAWYQWWDRDLKHNRPTRIIGFPINPGDLAFCNVQAVDLTHVIVSITNFTSSKMFSKKLKAPTVPQTGAVPQISGATAQWVVERPTVPNSDTLLDLVDYGKVRFIRCLASAAPAPAMPVAEFQNLDSARFVRMYDRLVHPPSTTWLSLPSRLTPDQQLAFKVTRA